MLFQKLTKKTNFCRDEAMVTGGVLSDMPGNRLLLGEVYKPVIADAADKGDSEGNPTKHDDIARLPTKRFNITSFVSLLLSTLMFSACGSTRSAQQPVAGSNRLIHESSPYLLEHAHDPVDWYPWGDEAFAKAKRENKPVLLSVGYSACHWCHVMQKESFQNKEIARLLNENYVCVKVDREERPDIDEVYMRAVQVISGRGGWPMTVFLTPDRKPFFAGTYFPPADSLGMPGFTRILAIVKDRWAKDRAQLDDSSKQIVSLVSRFDEQGRQPAKSDVEPKMLSAAISQILSQADQAWGGLGQAPKFPTPGALQLCLRESAGKRKNTKQGTACLSFVVSTLEKMAQGGIHDQIGGGFCRYSTDRKWQIPHFEKMLYDNVLLADVYLNAYLITGDSEMARTAEDTLDFMTHELAAPEGCFYSSLDADSDGKEGAYYVFTKREIEQTLQAEDSLFLENVFGVTGGGNFDNGLNVLCRSDTTVALATQHKMSETQFEAKLRTIKNKLMDIRNKRIRPRRDEKVIAAWNALAVSTYVNGYRILGKEEYLIAARKCARFILSKMYEDKRLKRIWAHGTAKEDGCLDDYAFTVQALLDLGSIDTSENWMSKAEELNSLILSQFHDARDGTFFFTAQFHQQPLTRTKSLQDNIMPSGTAVEIVNLIRLGELTGREQLRQMAAQTLNSCQAEMRENPVACSYMLCALGRYLNSTTQIVLVSPRLTDLSAQMATAMYRSYLPNALIVVRSPGVDKDEPEMLSGKKSLQGKPTVYVCQGRTCFAPIMTLSELRSKLQDLANRQ